MKVVIKKSKNAQSFVFAIWGPPGARGGSNENVNDD